MLGETVVLKAGLQILSFESWKDAAFLNITASKFLHNDWALQWNELLHECVLTLSGLSLDM